MDSGRVGAVAFVDFRKAFNIVSHEILEKKLVNSFVITGVLLDWIKDYLSGRMQFTVRNGVKSNLIYYPSQLEYLKDLCSARLSLHCLLTTYRRR